MPEDEAVHPSPYYDDVEQHDVPDGTASTVDPDNQPGEEEQPQEDAAAEETKTLCVTSPHTDHFVGFVDGHRYTVSRDGDEVPVSVADNLIETAASVGVQLTAKD